MYNLRGERRRRTGIVAITTVVYCRIETAPIALHGWHYCLASAAALIALNATVQCLVLAAGNRLHVSRYRRVFAACISVHASS